MKIFNRIGISLKPTPKFFQTIIVAIAIVMIWRGVWGLLDRYLFPSNELLSDLFSILIGLLIIYLPDKDIKELL